MNVSLSLCLSLLSLSPLFSIYLSSLFAHLRLFALPVLRLPQRVATTNELTNDDLPRNDNYTLAIPGGRRGIKPSDVLATGLPRIGAVDANSEACPPVIREEDWILVENGTGSFTTTGNAAASHKKDDGTGKRCSTQGPAAACRGENVEHARGDIVLLTPGLGWYHGSDGGFLQRALPVDCPVLHRVRIPRGEEKREERFSLPYLVRVMT